MKVATWNVNSIKARKERLLTWLARHQPDVLCLQELKLEDHAFPHAELLDAGYHAAIHGQKTYNGVAILSRQKASDVRIGLADDVDDPQARLIRAVVSDITFVSIYVPNGGEVGSEKYVYKQAWLDRFNAYLRQSCDPAQPLIVCGDLNIAPEDRDVARLDEWADSVLCTAEVRARFQHMLDFGLVDCFRRLQPEAGLYSWWDYRRLGFPKNNGLRIDHILATKSVADRCAAAFIDRDERKGKLPSDHAPVVAEFSEK